MGDRLAEGTAFGNLGNAHHRMGDFKTALLFHERHLKVAKELDDRSGEGKAYGNLGNVYQSLGDLKTAIKYHELHLNIAEELGDRSGEGRAYGNLGNAYHSLGDFKRAVDHHKRDLKIAKELGDRSGEGQAYCNLGNAYRHLGDFKKALSYHENDLKIVEELGDRSGKGRAYSNLGNAYLRLGDFETALDYHERSLEIAKEFGDRPGEGIAYGNLGNAHESLGNIKTAIDCYERLLNTSKKLGDRSGEGKAYSNLGNTQQRLGDFKSAIAYHEHHLKIAKELNDRSGEGAAYCNLGNAYDSLGHFKTAIDYYERHLKIEEQLGDRSGEGKAYGNLGNVYYSLGNFKTASDYHKRDLNIAQALGDRLGEERAYGNLGNTHHSLGDYVTAIQYHARALNIAKELGDTPGEGVAHGNLGNAYQSLGDFSTAIDYHKSVLKIAKALGDKSLEEKAYCNLGNAHYSLEDFKTAIDYHKRSMKTAKELGDTLGEGVTCSNLGKCFEILSQVPVAIEYYQLGITLFNNVRDRLELNDEWKISLRDNYPIVYTSLWRLLLAEGKVTEALFSAEQGRAQGLKDLLELNYAFKRGDVERSDARSGTGNKSVNDLLSYPFPNTFFMAFGENELNIWVCQRGKDVELKTKQIDSPDEVNIFFMDLLQVLHQEIGTRSLLKCEDRSLELARDESLAAKRSPQYGRETQDLGLTKDALSTLYEIMIEPIQDLFLGSELIFIPEGQLCLAPFAAFKGPDSKYVCESFKIRVAPSLTSLKMIEDCQVDYHHKSGALLVGDPLTERPPLPCAREEVEMIGRMLGITPVLGTQATKDEVLTRLGSVALVHIAAHGNMETGEIALASTEGVKENILTMRDVLGVQMRARLVVLSCCHSARGEIKAEGVVGIARAFLGAGARSVLVSLWAIDDEATLEFMKIFYQHLVKGISASESLNQTMNCMRESEEFNEVKYWAPFVLIGDDVTLEFAGNE